MNVNDVKTRIKYRFKKGSKYDKSIIAAVNIIENMLGPYSCNILFNDYLSIHQSKMILAKPSKVRLSIKVKYI